MRVAEANQLGVDHRVADPHVGQKPSPTIARLHVELEPYATAFDQAAIDGGRRAAARLFTLYRMMNLGGVDADVAHFLDAIGELNRNGYAVADANHGALDRGGGACPAGAEQQEQQRETPARGRHAATVSP